MVISSVGDRVRPERLSRGKVSELFRGRLEGRLREGLAASARERVDEASLRAYTTS